MDRKIESICDYISAVAWWSAKFREEMSCNASAALAILAYYLKGTSNLLVSPCEATSLRVYGEAMRQSSVMFAAAEDSGLFAEAIPRLFCLGLEKHSNWRLMYKDIIYLMNHMYLRHYVPYTYRCLAGAVSAELDLLLGDDVLWEQRLRDATKKLGERRLSAS